MEQKNFGGEKMKFWLFIFQFLVSTAFACVIGPQRIPGESAKGFEWVETDSDVCTDCRQVIVNSPRVYQGYPAAYAVFSVFMNDKLLSKSISKLAGGSDNVTFLAVINKAERVNYKISIMYGGERCMRYEIGFGNAIELSE